ncbi:twin-arginine translocation signal domain-containing protein [Nakamurella flavida]|uniref:Twin-arginine translocation signal domain-containing protein n=1 Tax=Nakamurella flavida TaxID=363630 RepID=A0A938YMG5_9ACTN|nr:twin-arginine translocation signal domain-containing protein [Nakamurella flavida]MBM9477251.1 twin-arginine translocation signal domain-containing protein [Nakamurella flavida]MDP9779707.1 hypothetical protein [Nakamurella flavida]
MTTTLSERVVSRLTRRAGRRPQASRRGFLGGAALTGAALAVNPWGYLVRPASAYDTVCGLDAGCNDGYSVFCCTINGGANSCPPNSFIGGWWKADNSSFCGGSARYYIDCNAYKGDGAWQCRCASGTCDERRVACNQFRYGQCSLEVPQSASGPVVCRMVSCTPPWQQYAGVCTASSATDNRTATHSAPCNGQDPVGALDGVTPVPGGIRLSGWALDQDQGGTEIQIAVYVDDGGRGWFPTGVPRSDVAAAYRVPGNHGFDVVVPADPGQHRVAVYAINVGGGATNPLLGTRTATAGPPAVRSPIGNLDGVTPGPDGTVRVTGWAVDPDAPATAIPVAVYRNGQGVAWFPTGGDRPDVNAALGVGGRHGFAVTLTVPPGDHEIAVFGIDDDGRAGNSLLGVRTVRGTGSPRGSLDSAVDTGGAVRLAGWAYDPDRPDDAIQVAVYRDDTGIAWFPTGGERPDVNSAFGIGGRHGFVVTVPTAPGRHTFTVFAINVGAAAGNPVIGSLTVDVR